VSYNHDNLTKEKLEPLQTVLDLNAAELKKNVLTLPSLPSLNHDSLVAEKLDPLQARLELTNAELKKIVLRLPAVLGLNHDSLVTKLGLQQKCLGKTDVEFRDAVLVEASALGTGAVYRGEAGADDE
jgi:mTERF domain-containing protein